VCGGFFFLWEGQEESPPCPVHEKTAVRILKLVAREAHGQRGIGDPQSSKNDSRKRLKNRKEQTTEAAYLQRFDDEAEVTIITRASHEAADVCPEAAKTVASRRSKARRKN